MKNTLLSLHTIFTLASAYAQNIFKDDFSTYSINQELNEHENKFTDISAGN